MLLITDTKELSTVTNMIVYPVGRSKLYDKTSAKKTPIQPKIVAKINVLNLCCTTPI